MHLYAIIKTGSFVYLCFTVIGLEYKVEAWNSTIDFFLHLHTRRLTPILVTLA